jgi:hypothetical protein
MPHHHNVDERPERLALEQLHGARDDARVDGQQRMMAPASRIRSRTKGRSSMMEVSWAGALKASLSLEDVARVERVLWDYTPGMRMGLIVETAGR